MLIDFRVLKSVYNINPTSIVHVGAHKAEEWRLYEKTWKKLRNVVWIEADPNLIKDIKSRVPKSHDVIEVAVWHEEKSLQFYRSNVSLSSSLLELKEHSKYYPKVVMNEIIEVQGSILDVTLNRKECDFLNLDIQGAELSALKGFTEGLNRVRYIYCEVNKIELYKAGAHVSEIDNFLIGFNFIRLHTVWTKFGWGDAVYIQRGSLRLIAFRRFIAVLALLAIKFKSKAIKNKSVQSMLNINPI